MSVVSLTDTLEWKALEAHQNLAKKWHMREMFETDPNRFDKFRCVLICYYLSCSIV